MTIALPPLMPSVVPFLAQSQVHQIACLIGFGQLYQSETTRSAQKASALDQTVRTFDRFDAQNDLIFDGNALAYVQATHQPGYFPAEADIGQLTVAWLAPHEKILVCQEGRGRFVNGHDPHPFFLKNVNHGA